MIHSGERNALRCANLVSLVDYFIHYTDEVIVDVDLLMRFAVCLHLFVNNYLLDKFP